MMEAVRNGAWAKSGYTAKDYVQDGLIAMWDGIENAGWGVHDTTIVGWRNLVGNGDIALSYPHEWDGKSLINYGDSVIYSLIGFDIGSVLRTGNYALQVVYKSFVKGYKPIIRNYAWGNGSIWNIEQAGESIVFWDSLKHNNLGIVPIENRVAMTLRSANGYWTLKGLGLDDGRENSIESSGKVDTSQYKTTAYTIGHQAEYNFIRLYDRALTDDEIAANYAIDKARFNLP